MNALARLLGIKSTDEIHDINLKFAAWWSEGRPVFVLLVRLPAARALSLSFSNEQSLEKKKRRRIALTYFVVCRLPRSDSSSLSLSFLFLLQNILAHLPDVIYGSDSMNLVDELSNEQAEPWTK